MGKSQNSLLEDKNKSSKSNLSSQSLNQFVTNGGHSKIALLLQRLPSELRWSPRQTPRVALRLATLSFEAQSRWD